MKRDFRSIEWDEQTCDDCRRLLHLAIREDLGRGVDLTTVGLVPREARGEATVVAREAGVIAGTRAIPLLIEEMQLDATWEPRVEDGQQVSSSTALGILRGSTRDLLTSERILLNLLGRLCGIATLTRRYVEAIANTQARIYDTRKTTPGWRRLEKYAVRLGGGANHREGLFDAVLIKDNHLAQVARATGSLMSPAQAVERSRRFLAEFLPGASVVVEVEVDTLEQFREVLPLQPDIILLDNMPPDDLRVAVHERDAAGVPTELEASGGINLQSVRRVAETGVDRISSGALTHAATSLDVALDWVVV